MNSLLHKFNCNSRFRGVAPFGPSTIRRFAHNVADLSKLAARDFEDILQVRLLCHVTQAPIAHFF
jgi:hypothetical protein